uniref:FCP1 homology domain-containing protein n=1 Tax=Ditylenchus dipsaci TaxID=166011 RepID=A0A915DBM5_9BILA
MIMWLLFTMSSPISYDLLFEIGQKYLLRTLQTEGSGFDCCKFMLINSSCQNIMLTILKQNLDLLYIDLDNTSVESTTKRGARIEDHHMGLCLKPGAPMTSEMEEIGIFRFYLTELFYCQAIVNGGWPLEFINRLRNNSQVERATLINGNKRFGWEESRMESYLRLTIPQGVDLANPNLVELEEYFQSHISHNRSPLKQCLQNPADWDQMSRMLNLNSIKVFVSISDQCGREFQPMPEPSVRVYAPRTTGVTVMCASPSRILEMGSCYDVELWKGGGHMQTLFYYLMQSCPNLELIKVQIHHAFLPPDRYQLSQFADEVFTVIKCLIESYVPSMSEEEVVLHLEFPITVCIALKPFVDAMVKEFSERYNFQFFGKTYTMRHIQNHFFIVQWKIDFS